MGRHKGSRNKKTLLIEAGSIIKEKTVIPIIKRGRGRPPGSKNKGKADQLEAKPGIIQPGSQPASIVKRGRGRPRKSIQTQTTEKPAEITGNKKNIDLEIKKLKRLKLKCRAGSQERIDLHRQIKELKTKINNIQDSITPEKLELIKKIEAKKPSYYKDLNIDLTVYSMEQLTDHYKRILERGTRI